MTEVSLYERVEGAVGRALMRLPQPVQRRIVGRPIELDGLRLDTTSQMLLLLERLSGTTSEADADVSPARAREVTSRQARAIAHRSAAVSFHDSGPGACSGTSTR